MDYQMKAKFCKINRKSISEISSKNYHLGWNVIAKMM